jgi:hypothetical protein
VRERENGFFLENWRDGRRVPTAAFGAGFGAALAFSLPYTGLVSPQPLIDAYSLSVDSIWNVWERKFSRKRNGIRRKRRNDCERRKREAGIEQ